MLEIINYTTNTSAEFGYISEFLDYLEVHAHQELGLGNNDVTPKNLEEAGAYLDLSDEDKAKYELAEAICGQNYFNTIQNGLDELENHNFITIEGVSTLRETAYKLDHEFYLEDELYTLLGCSKEHYEALGQYISTDDVENLLDREYDVNIIANTAYISL